MRYAQSTFTTLALVTLAIAGLPSCSGSDNGTSNGVGGNGGTTAMGGSLALGGTTASGGVAAGGAAAMGGMVATGGSKAAGGMVATGGSKAAGGMVATGGSNATGGTAAAGGSQGTGGMIATGGSRATGGTTTTGGSAATGGTQGTGGSVGTGGVKNSGGTTGLGGNKASGGMPGSGGSAGTGGMSTTGWLYTNGNKIYVSNGTSAGTPWMGRGVNLDDTYLCGYNYTLWMTSPEQTLKTIHSGLISRWKPNFLRISLSMNSNPTVTSWLSNPSQYKTPMTGVINALGANPNVYVLVTLRSDVSMIGQDTVDGDPEATGLPSDSSTTPKATLYPTGTDAVYVALVDTFANSNFVLFGLTNEPGGNKLSNATIAAAMKHAVGVIRAEEDRLGVPHHIVSVQGNGWTSDISFYSTTPLTYDNVVYEVHGYPPATSSYTYANIPVIIGEYGSLSSGSSAGFYADLEAKQIPNLAWDFEPYSDCAPDLVSVTQSATTLTPTAWGSTVQSYLLAHAP